MIDENALLESMQKHAKEVCAESSLHPDNWARIIELMGSSAQGARELYSGISLIQILVSPEAVAWGIVATEKARVRRLHGEYIAIAFLFCVNEGGSRLVVTEMLKDKCLGEARKKVDKTM
jgi:hypothetical protein